VKFRRDEIHAPTHKVPEIRFEDQAQPQLTSFAGLVIYQALFQRLQFSLRLRRCFAHLPAGSIYGLWRIFLWLVIHLILGDRRLRDRDYYAEDPLLLRVVGLSRLPDTSTISRMLAAVDDEAVARLREMSRKMVLERLAAEGLARVTMDFDGSVLSTQRHAEGTAIGFNKKKKGARSYYPLFCTIAQLAQVLDVHHRPGNGHTGSQCGM
jgi:hypothetical protein